eukprot:c55824_g1_i1 orf=38-187(+)
MHDHHIITRIEFWIHLSQYFERNPHTYEYLHATPPFASNSDALLLHTCR